MKEFLLTSGAVTTGVIELTMQYRVGTTKCTVTLKGLSRTSESTELLTKEADNYNNLYMRMILDLEGKLLEKVNLSA
jgi:hypothetical protein